MVENGRGQDFSGSDLLSFPGIYSHIPCAQIFGHCIVKSYYVQGNDSVEARAAHGHLEE